jgi:hypothetical protein
MLQCSLLSLLLIRLVSRAFLSVSNRLRMLLAPDSFASVDVELLAAPCFVVHNGACLLQFGIGWRFDWASFKIWLGRMKEKIVPSVTPMVILAEFLIRVCSSR